MESPVSGRPGVAIAMEIPVRNADLPCTPPAMPAWLRKRLSEPKTPAVSTVEEIEAKLRDADLRRQKFYENLSSKARPKPRSSCRSLSHETDLAQRLKTKLLAAEEKRLSILNNALMRLAKLDESRQVARTMAEERFNRQRAELGTKVEMRIRKAEVNRLLLLRAYRQKRAAVKERTSQSLMTRGAKERKYKESVRDAIYQKRAAAEKKRSGLLEAEKRRARHWALQVQKIANDTHKQEFARSETKKKLEDRLKMARTKRAEYLMQRGRPCNNIHEQADTLSKKLARSWREFKKQRKTTAHLAEVFNELNINEKSVKAMPFDQLALLIQSVATLCKAKPLLDRLESRYKLSQAVGSAANPSARDDIGHLLKRVATPKERESPFSCKGENPVKLSRYQVRIVLCAYMIVGHPDTVISGQGEREVALVKSAGIFVQEFESLIKILLNGQLHVSSENSDNEFGTQRTFRLQLVAFDSAWCSFLNSFVVWKAKDARSLEEDLIRTACRLELSMIQTCKTTPESVAGPLPYELNAVQKQVSEDLKLLREKVVHLSGDAGIERMENALSEMRMIFFKARQDGSSLTSSGSLNKASNFTEAAPKQSSMVQTLFEDRVNTKNVNSTESSSRISQSPVENLDMKNVMIVNEYVHGEHLTFGDNLSTSTEHRNILEKCKETMEKAFWDGIVESVKQDEPNYGHVVELMREVRDEIHAMAPHSWRHEVFESIDLEILPQVLNSGRLDIDYLGKIMEFALITLQKLCAPAFEDELKKKHQQFMEKLAQTCSSSDDTSENSHVVALIKGLRFVLEQIQELKQEISKARIRMLEPFLKGPDALSYLGKFFTNCYGHPSNAQDALPLTAKWLSSVRGGKDEEWNEHKNSLSELMRKHENSSTFLPSTTLQTGGTLVVKMSGNEADASSTSNANYMDANDPNSECKEDEIDLLVRLGLLKLVSKIAGLTEGELPETLTLNLSRLRNVQSRVQKITVIATSLLVLRQTLLSELMVTSQSDMESILLTSFKKLSICLDSGSDAGVQDIVETLSKAIEENEKFENVKLPPMKEIMARVLNKSLQEEDTVFGRVSRAVYLAAKRVLLGGGKKGRELAEMALQKIGAALLLDDVVQAASALRVMAKVSVVVHGPWYANLMK